MVEETFETMEKQSSFRDRVMDAVGNKNTVPNKTVPISFPKKTFSRFSAWALDNANDCYWLAIEKLLDTYENKEFLQNQLEVLGARDEVFMGEIARLEAEIMKLKTPEVPTEKPKHFGKKEAS
jgi:hypothetical protein